MLLRKRRAFLVLQEDTQQEGHSIATMGPTCGEGFGRQKIVLRRSSLPPWRRKKRAPCSYRNRFGIRADRWTHACSYLIIPDHNTTHRIYQLLIQLRKYTSITRKIRLVKNHALHIVWLLVQELSIKCCGECSGCVATDCGSCITCKDMKKFGGPGRKKRCCVQWKCVKLARTTLSNLIHLQWFYPPFDWQPTQTKWNQSHMGLILAHKCWPLVRQRLLTDMPLQQYCVSPH